MAKMFKGKLPSDQREMTIIEIEGGEVVRSWDAGLDRRQSERLVRKAVYRATKGPQEGARYTVRNVICAEGGRGEVIRELRVLTDGVVHAAGSVPIDYR